MNTYQLPYADSILLELLEVSIHHVIFQRQIYPDSIFILQKKYGVPVHVSRYPPLNAYIKDCLMSIKELLRQKQLKKVFICFFNEGSKPLERLVLNIQSVYSDITVENVDSMSDPYNTKLEESLRAVCLRLTVIGTRTKALGERATFQIQVETTETAAATLAADPDSEHFPWIEMEEEDNPSQDPTCVKLLPIRNIKSDLFDVELFYEKLE